VNAELERRVLACPALPTLPAVVLQIIRLCHADEVDLRKIAEALATDPALTARVLRAANSASLAARGKVGTLTRAVPLLGSKAVTAIALSFALVRGRRRDDAATGFDRAAFWRRAVFAALAGRTLAEGAAPEVDPEEAFIAALLQDLGMLALAEVFSRDYSSLCASSGGDHDALVALERRGWGADHSDVSALLARSWRFPAALERAVAASHAGPAPGAADAEGRLMGCVALSGHLADLWVAPAGGDAPRSGLGAACQRLGFDPAALEAILARMALSVPEASADFDIDLGGRERVEAALAEARRLLGALGLATQEPALGHVVAGEALDRSMRFAFACARRRREPISLLLLSFAPSAPEERSRSLLPLVRREVRATDLLGTAAPGEIFLLLSGSDGAAGLAVARRIMQLGAGSPGLELNIGVASTGPHAAFMADRARAALADAMASARALGGGQILAVEVGGGVRRENLS
jgi:HD-like signal output (HDOD) protein